MKMIPSPQSGYETSSPPDTSPPETWMSGQSSMFGPMTSEDTASVIGSPASEGGPTLFDWLDGTTTGNAGQEAAPASPSAPPAGARRPMTNVICGLNGHLSSRSAALEQSLVSRLRRRLDGAGSTLFSLTWRRKSTPAHRPYYQLVASAHPTSANDFGGWPTPAQQDGPHGAATLEAAENEARRRSWGNSLDVAVFAPWATPTTRDHKDGSSDGTVPVNGLLGRQVWGSGTTSSGSPAATGGQGQLNGAFSRWLQGYPEAWDVAAIKAWRSTRTTRRKGG
jgi:hypothetical protein